MPIIQPAALRLSSTLRRFDACHAAHDLSPPRTLPLLAMHAPRTAHCRCVFILSTLRRKSRPI
jgi:hypothetical protein